jgi:hypothetical protein
LSYRILDETSKPDDLAAAYREAVDAGRPGVALYAE